TAARHMRDLGTLGAPASIALGIYNCGAVVGGSGRAFLWTEQTGIVDLGTLGGRTSCANDVNELGCVVGVSQTGHTDRRGLPVTHAFLRTPAGKMLDLGTLGGEHSSAAAISEENGGVLWIAGHSHDTSAQVRAVLWVGPGRRPAAGTGRRGVTGLLRLGRGQTQVENAGHAAGNRVLGGRQVVVDKEVVVSRAGAPPPLCRPRPDARRGHDTTRRD